MSRRVALAATTAIGTLSLAITGLAINALSSSTRVRYPGPLDIIGRFPLWSLFVGLGLGAAATWLQLSQPSQPKSPTSGQRAAGRTVNLSGGSTYIEHAEKAFSSAIEQTQDVPTEVQTTPERPVSRTPVVLIAALPWTEELPWEAMTMDLAVEANSRTRVAEIDKNEHKWQASAVVILAPAARFEAVRKDLLSVIRNAVAEHATATFILTVVGRAEKVVEDSSGRRVLRAAGCPSGKLLICPTEEIFREQMYAQLRYIITTHNMRLAEESGPQSSADQENR